MDHHLSLLLKTARIHMAPADADAFANAVENGPGYEVASVSAIDKTITFHRHRPRESEKIRPPLMIECTTEQGAIEVGAKLKQYFVTIGRTTPVFPIDD